MSNDQAQLRREVSPRLTAYALLGAVGLLGGLAAGRAELVAVAAPFALLAIAGVVLADAPTVSGQLTLDRERVLEGDGLTGSVELRSSPSIGTVDVLVGLDGPATPDGPRSGTLGLTGRPGHDGTVSLPVELGTPSWGVVRVGPVHVRLYGPLDLVRWRGVLPLTGAARVLPPAATLRQLLGPHEPRNSAGAHRSARRGDGFEFAEVRPYTPGDRLRALNWAVTARRGQPWVNLRHPERAADVVLVVDTFAEEPTGRASALLPAVRAAWALAAGHLRAQDRVGLVAFGGYPSWLPPGSGDRARYALLDRFLALQATWTEAQRSAQLIPPRVVPPGAQLIALTPLRDERIARALADLRGRGLEVAALVIDVAGEPLAPPGPSGELARRLWLLDHDRRVRQLEAAGVAVVRWPTGDTDVAEAVAALQLRRRGRGSPAPRSVAR